MSLNLKTIIIALSLGVLLTLGLVFLGYFRVQITSSEAYNSIEEDFQ